MSRGWRHAQRGGMQESLEEVASRLCGQGPQNVALGLTLGGQWRAVEQWDELQSVQVSPRPTVQKQEEQVRHLNLGERLLQLGQVAWRSRGAREWGKVQHVLVVAVWFATGVGHSQGSGLCKSWQRRRQ